MLYDVVLIVSGLGLVAKGGDLFVDSSISIGQALGVPRFVIGGTLVSLATTTPELVVSAMASRVGDSGIALGTANGRLSVRSHVNTTTSTAAETIHAARLTKSPFSTSTGVSNATVFSASATAA